jgi:hypothetical protein
MVVADGRATNVVPRARFAAVFVGFNFVANS